MNRSRVLCSLVALVALPACASPASTPSTVPAGTDLTVTAIRSLNFDAESYGPVPAGDVSVAYRNEDLMRHTLVLAKDGTVVPGFKLVVAARGDIDAGTVRLEPGEYTLICDVPGHANMRASLTVS